ncbi:MAG TPA: TIGR02757 family protein [Bacteroidales bacterium]|nr:TIGR02757 family protein [Bacteroidales bacterium]
MLLPNNLIKDLQEIKQSLDWLVIHFNTPAFIEKDPISVPHRFSKKEDIEIAAFLAATIAWGQRTTILNNANKLMGLMDNAPYDFVTGHTQKDLQRLNGFVHRTFNEVDCIFFIKSLQNIYSRHNGLEGVFNTGFHHDNTVFSALVYFRKLFFETEHQYRSEKHISDVTKGAAAKRINMFLRWMVRQDKCGVDFGIWRNIPASALMLPLDVHTANSARQLGLLVRTQNDWKAVEEIMSVLRKFDPHDPVKYDFALFGASIEKIFLK